MAIKNQFSNEIIKLATVEQAKERYKLSRNTLYKWAREVGAFKKIGKSTRIDCGILDAELEKQH